MPWSGPDGALIVTFTGAASLFLTVTVEGLNETLADPAVGAVGLMTSLGPLITPFVASAGSCSNVYVTPFPVPGRLLLGSVRVPAPPWLAPRGNSLVVNSAFASIAPRTSSP